MHLATPLARLIAPARPDPAFVRLADQLEQAVLLVSPGALRIQHANHAATLLTGYSRAELARLTLPQVCQSAELREQLRRLEGYLPPRTLLDSHLLTRAGRTLTVDLRLTRAADHPDAPLLVLAEDAAPRIQASQALSRMSRSLEAFGALIALNLEPDEAAIEHAVGLVRLYTAADGAGLYRVLPGEPGLALTARVELGPAFPERLPAQESRYLLQPEVWHNTQRAEHALSQAARFAGWATLLSYPVGEASAHLGVLFVGYRPGRPPPERPLLGIAARQVYLIARQVAQQRALAEITAAQQALAHQLQTVLAQSRDAIILLGPDGRVQQVNPPASELFGYSAAEAVGMPFQDLLISPQPLTGPILAALQQGKPASASHILLHSRSGEAVPTAIEVLPVTVAGAPAAGQGLLIVVANHSQAEAVEQRTQQLEQRALVGDLSAILAHEVRNPINNISANAQLLARKQPPDSPWQEKLSQILQETGRLTRLMDDVLQSSRPLEIARRPCQLGEVVATVLDRWAPRCARAGVQVRRELAPGLPAALIDPRSIERVLTNLVDNALHAMPGGGTLTVTLDAAQNPPRPPLMGGSEGGGSEGAVGEAEGGTPPPPPRPPAHLALKIADSGHGMDEDTRLRIFDPFYTTRSQGTGLGLSITRHIVRTVHKGTIHVQSFPDAGTIFTILLPVAP